MALIPLRISYNNLHSLLLNAFLPDWLTSFMNYPLGIQNVASVWLRRGKSGIHLDNKEHAILSHCLAFDKTKLATAQLGLNLVIDIDHWREAKAHRGFIIAQREEQGLRDPEVCSSLTVSLLNFSHVFFLQPRVSNSTPTLLVSHTEARGPSQLTAHPRSRVKPRAIFASKGKKCKLSEISESSDSDPEVLGLLGENKRSRSGQGSSSQIAAPVEDIWQALIAQREPQQAAICGLHMCSLSM